MLSEKPSPTTNREAKAENNINIYLELKKIEEIIIDSPRLPLVGVSLVNEENLLAHVDNIRLNLPDALREALAIVQKRDEIIEAAEEYFQNLITKSEQQAAEILDQTRILQQAELEAQEIRQQVEQECQALRQKTIAEVEEMREIVRQEIAQWRQNAIAECEAIQAGADEYAANSLNKLQEQLSAMLRIVQNGQRQLQQHSAPTQTKQEQTSSQLHP